jgi:hypothetical protein
MDSSEILRLIAEEQTGRPDGDRVPLAARARVKLRGS